jgi:molybdopterin-containing oxidoreductase family membrane subunit
MVPIFLTSATASGIALLLLVAYLFKRFKILDLKPSMFRSLSTVLATVIISDLFLLVVEIGVVFWPTSAKPGHVARFAQFINGPYAFTLPVVLVLGAISFALLAPRPTRHKPWVQITAASLYVVAIWLKRYTLMAMGFAVGTLGQYNAPYAPSLTEVLLALGILSLGALIMTAGAKVLPLRVPEDEHGEEAHDSEAPAAEPLAEVG